MAVIKEFEQRYVHDVYIWETYARRRASKRWKKVEDFISSFPTGSLLADIGCGEGQYLTSKSSYILGLERCDRKCFAIQDEGKEVLSGNILSLPYRSGMLDGLICVAVIHHLATKKRRLRAVREISRVLLTGGRAFLSVLAMDSVNDKFSGQDVLMPIKTKSKEVSNIKEIEERRNIDDPSKANTLSNQALLNNRFLPTATGENESLQPSTSKLQAKNDQLRKKSEENIQVFKYYHIFTDMELNLIINQVKKLKILDKFFDNRNWVYILEKL